MLAGCTSPPASDPTLDPSLRAPAEEPVRPSGAAPPDAGDPPPPAPAPGGAGEEPALPPSEGTRWVRAYWGDAAVLPVADVNFTHSLGFSSFGGTIVGSGFSPDKGRLVAPGTAALRVVATWEQPATAPGVTLSFLVAPRGGNWANETLALRSGETMELPVGGLEPDRPGAERSAWRLAVGYEAGPSDVFTELRVHVVVEAVRGPVLPEFPEPPDAWGGADRLVLVPPTPQDVLLYHSRQGESSWSYACIGCDTMTWRPQNGTLVPPGARLVRVVVTWDSPLPAVPEVWATSPAGGGWMDPVEEGPGRRAFEVPVEANATDSPYDAESRWSFSVIVTSAGTEYGVATGRITLEAEVLRG